MPPSYLHLHQLAKKSVLSKHTKFSKPVSEGVPIRFVAAEAGFLPPGPAVDFADMLCVCIQTRRYTARDTAIAKTESECFLGRKDGAMTRPKKRRSLLSQRAPDPSFSPAIPRPSAFENGDERQDREQSKSRKGMTRYELRVQCRDQDQRSRRIEKIRNQSHPHNLFPSST